MPPQLRTAALLRLAASAAAWIYVDQLEALRVGVEQSQRREALRVRLEQSQRREALRVGVALQLLVDVLQLLVVVLVDALQLLVIRLCLPQLRFVVAAIARRSSNRSTIAKRSNHCSFHLTIAKRPTIAQRSNYCTLAKD